MITDKHYSILVWVFGIYDDPTVPGQAAVGVESVTDHLKKSNL